MTLTVNPLFIQPTFDDEHPVFIVYKILVGCELELLRQYGTIGEALAFIEGYHEGRIKIFDEHRMLTDHDIAAGS